MQTKIIICKGCNEKFNIPLWKKQLYCTFDCYNNHREKYMIKCSFCEKAIKIIGNRYKKSKHKLFFCSKDCQARGCNSRARGGGTRSSLG